MGNVGIPELILIFLLALLLFGPQKLPELGRNLGKALAEFRRASAGLRESLEQNMRELEREVQEREQRSSEPPKLPADSEASGVTASAQPAALPEAPSDPEKPADGNATPAA